MTSYSNDIGKMDNIDHGQRPITILYFGTYEETYPRNRIIMKSLKNMGHIVKECHISLWGNKTDKTVYFKRGHDAFLLLFRLLTAYPRLVLRYVSLEPYDVVFVGYMGHLDVLVVKFLEFITGRRKKIIFDAFISLYDTIVLDRRMIRKDSIMARCIYQLDRVSCSFADVILLDTDAHIEFFGKAFRMPGKKFFKIYAGAETSIFYPREIQGSAGGFKVLFMGKYTPLHGIEYIVEAADLLRNQRDLQFVFIGKGQLYKQIRTLVRNKNLKNIFFIKWVAYETLPDYIKRADICLGVFSKSAKANRVIPNKIFQAMAMGKPVISGKTDGVLECLTHRGDIFLCEPGDPAALAQAIMTLKSDANLRKRIAAKALQTFEEDLGDKAAISVLEKVLNSMCPVSGSV